MTFFSYFWGLKLTWKPKGDHIEQKCCQNAPRGPPEGVQSRKMIPTGSQREAQGSPKMSQKSHFWATWATGVPQRVPRGSPGTPRSPKSSQNGAKWYQNPTKNTNNKGQRLNKIMIEVLCFFGWLALPAAATPSSCKRPGNHPPHKLSKHNPTTNTATTQMPVWPWVVHFKIRLLPGSWMPASVQQDNKSPQQQGKVYQPSKAIGSAALGLGL